MIVAILASLVGLVVALVEYYRDEPIERREVIRPGWSVLPEPGEVARTEFPLVHLGYDPATVEVHFEALNRAYGHLLATAPPEVVERARQRAGLSPEGHETTAATGRPSAAPRGAGRHAAPTASREAGDAEALRAEAALADLDAGDTHPRR